MQTHKGSALVARRKVLQCQLLKLRNFLIKFHYRSHLSPSSEQSKGRTGTDGFDYKTPPGLLADFHRADWERAPAPGTKKKRV